MCNDVGRVRYSVRVLVIIPIGALAVCMRSEDNTEYFITSAVTVAVMVNVNYKNAVQKVSGKVTSTLSRANIGFDVFDKTSARASKPNYTRTRVNSKLQFIHKRLRTTSKVGEGKEKCDDSWKRIRKNSM